jgi:hypothetical protein
MVDASMYDRYQETADKTPLQPLHETASAGPEVDSMASFDTGVPHYFQISYASLAYQPLRHPVEVNDPSVRMSSPIKRMSARYSRPGPN